jgi:type IV secretion system protein VirB4
MNPFRMAPTPENIAFLTGWVRMLLENSGPRLTATESVKVETAVRLVMNLPASERSMAVMLQNITEGLTAAERDNSLPRRLAKWYGEGDLAWAFPPGEDVIDLDASPVIGVDGTEFLDNEELCAAIGAYLLHRVRQSLGGRRAVLVMDEFWMWVRNPVFGAFAEDMLKTIRKFDALVILATQSPSDVFRTPHARAVVEQTSTKIFLANPQADRDEYRGALHLNEAEFQFVRNLTANSRCALVKQSSGAAAVRVDLSAFPKDLRILSSTPENIRLMHLVLDDLRARGRIQDANNPDAWLPIFHRVVDEASGRK